MRLEGVLGFLRFVGALAGGLLALCVIGFAISDKEAGTTVLYALTFGINALVLVGAHWIPKWILRRQSRLKGGMDGKERGHTAYPDTVSGQAHGRNHTIQK